MAAAFPFNIGARLIFHDEFLPFCNSELVVGNRSPSHERGTMGSPTAFAMAMRAKICRRCDFELNSLAVAAASNHFSHNYSDLGVNARHRLALLASW